MKTMTLATFKTVAQAQGLLNRLEEAHVAVWLHGGGILRRLWFVRRLKREVWLEVDEKDFQKSQRLLQELEKERGTTARVIHCPECHSSRVVFPQFTRKFFLPNLIGLLAGLGLIRKKYYCEDCHYTWLPQPEKPDKRTHLAPYYFLEGVDEIKAEAAENAKSAGLPEKAGASTKK